MLHWRPLIGVLVIGLLTAIATVGGAIHWNSLLAG
jgi:hypothetical protein